MSAAKSRADALLRSPLGCAFFAEAQRLGLSAATIAEPLVTLQLAAQALRDASIWQVNYDEVVDSLLAAAGGLRSLVAAVLAQPGAAWWFTPMDRAHQLALEEISAIAVPSGPPTTWERYAQKPAWGRYTSTEVNESGLSSFLFNSIRCTGDLGPVHFPAQRYRVAVSPEARVFTVNSPEDWRALCLRYPAAYEEGQIVPDFGAAAAEWDAVHLTMGGLLSTAQVRIEGPEGWTWLDGWETEQTIWIRPLFRSIERLPDLVERPVWDAVR